MIKHVNRSTVNFDSGVATAGHH